MRRVVTGSLGEIIATNAPAPGLEVVLATGLFAVLATGSTFISLTTGQSRALLILNLIGTIVHEAGHALVSVVTGGRVYRVGVTSAESGFTSQSQSWPGTIFSLAAGYAMPPLAGLGAAWLLDRGQASTVLTFTVVIMVVLLFVSDGIRTIAFVLAVGILAFATLYWGPPELQGFVACSEAWLLLTSEIGGLAHIVANRVHGGRPDDAASQTCDANPDSRGGLDRSPGQS